MSLKCFRICDESSRKELQWDGARVIFRITKEVLKMKSHHKTAQQKRNTQHGTATQSSTKRRTALSTAHTHTELHFSVLTPMLAQCSSILALTYTTQVRSSGSQVCVGNRNHRAEPLPVLRRAPTLTDEQRQQRVGLGALSPSELLPQSAKERHREG